MGRMGERNPGKMTGGEIMETNEIILTVTVHRRERDKSGQARRRTSLRRWIARLNGWTVAWYALLTVAGILLYKAGAAYAMWERWYSAVGGEILALALPVMYYAASTIIGDIVRDAKDRGRKW